MDLTLLPSLEFRPSVFLAGYPGPWASHIPFAHDLIAAERPALVVELGAHFGDSYFAFCQTIVEHRISSTCYAVDTWKGDPQAGFYGDSVWEAVARHNTAKYQSFSYLLREEFDQVVDQFRDNSIELLHIDGLHTYHAVRHDFDNWFPKVKPGGIILLHDISVRSNGFGVWRLWEEIREQHRSFEFRSGSGLGVLEKADRTGPASPFVEALFASGEDERETLRRYYHLCSERLHLEHQDASASLTGWKHSRIQAFYSRTGDYQEDESRFEMVPTDKWVQASVHLPPRQGQGPLRLDICNGVAVVDVRSISVKDLSGRQFWTWTPRNLVDKPVVNGSAMQLETNDCLRIFSYGSDPQLYLPAISDLPAHEPLEISLFMRIDPSLEVIREGLSEILDPQLRSGKSLLKLYVDRGEGYAEADAVTHVMPAGEPEVVRVMLPDGVGRSPLRLDPCDRPALIDITSLELVGSGGQSLWKWNPFLGSSLRVARTAMELPSDDSLRIFSYGVDPQLYLPALNEFWANESLELRIDIKVDYKFTGLHESLVEAGIDPEALAAIKAERESLRASYAREKQIRLDMEQSRSWQITRPLRRKPLSA